MARKSNNDINQRMFYALLNSERSKVPVLFMSAPGMGKSTTVELFAEARGFELVRVRGNSSSREDVAGFDAVPRDLSKKTTDHLRPSWFDAVIENNKIGKKSLLFLDELTTCTEDVQSALLHLIFERMVGAENIPDDCLIVAAGNYAQSLSHRNNLLPPLMNRFCIYNVIPEKDDIYSFLCRYDGASLGRNVTATSWRQELIDDFKKSIKTVHDYNSEEISKIGEYIERAIKDTVEYLQSPQKKAVDFKVSDMQNTFQDTSDSDDILRGFITPRTLNFLVEMTLAAYLNYGKTGVLGPNYKLMVEGLVGIGLTRDNQKDVKVTMIASDFVDSIKLAVIEIEKMSNQKIPAYNKFFADMLVKGGKTELDAAKISACVEKLRELSKDPDVNTVQRPIDGSIIESLVDSTRYTMSIIAKDKNFSGGSVSALKSQIKTEDLVGSITRWNQYTKLLEAIKKLVIADKYAYNQDFKARCQKTFANIIQDSQKLKIVRAIIVDERTNEASLIPDIEQNFKIEESDVKK